MSYSLPAGSGAGRDRRFARQHDWAQQALDLATEALRPAAMEANKAGKIPPSHFETR